MLIKIEGASCILEVMVYHARSNIGPSEIQTAFLGNKDDFINFCKVSKYGSKNFHRELKSRPILERVQRNLLLLRQK